MPDETSFCSRPLCSISSTSLEQYDEAIWVRDDISRIPSAPLDMAARTFVQPSSEKTSDDTMLSASRENTDM